MAEPCQPLVVLHPLGGAAGSVSAVRFATLRTLSAWRSCPDPPPVCWGFGDDPCRLSPVAAKSGTFLANASLLAGCPLPSMFLSISTSSTFSLAEPPASSFFCRWFCYPDCFSSRPSCRLVFDLSVSRAGARLRAPARVFDLSSSRADGKRDCLSVAIPRSCCGGRRRSAPMRRRNRAGSSREALIGSWSANDLPFFPRSEMRRSPTPSRNLAGGGRGWGGAMRHDLGVPSTAGRRFVAP